MPELLELKTEWTQNYVNSSGNDTYGEEGTIDGVPVELGSTCC